MARMFDDIVRNLEEWSQEQKLVEQAIEFCKINIQSCAREEAELFPEQNTGPDVLRGCKISDIQLRFDKQALVFKSDILSYPYVDTRIGLYVANPDSGYFRDLEPIGHYRLIVTLDGDIDDDYLVLDKELQDEG